MILVYNRQLFFKYPYGDCTTFGSLRNILLYTPLSFMCPVVIVLYSAQRFVAFTLRVFLALGGLCIVPDQRVTAYSINISGKLQTFFSRLAVDSFIYEYSSSFLQMSASFLAQFKYHYAIKMFSLSDKLFGRKRDSDSYKEKNSFGSKRCNYRSRRC